MQINNTKKNTKKIKTTNQPCVREGQQRLRRATTMKQQNSSGSSNENFQQ